MEQGGREKGREQGGREKGGKMQRRQFIKKYRKPKQASKQPGRSLLA